MRGNSIFYSKKMYFKRTLRSIKYRTWDRLTPGLRYCLVCLALFVSLSVFASILHHIVSSSSLKYWYKYYTADVTFVVSEELFKEPHTRHDKIPHVVHQTWKNRLLPPVFVPYVKSWRLHHPRWKYLFWTDVNALHFIQRLYPEQFVLYYALNADVERADVLRYLIMYELGGVYADLDMESLKPLDAYISGHECILASEPLEHAYLLHNLERPLASNAFIACRRRHPFFRFVIDNLERYYRLSHLGIIEDTPVDTTGPKMLAEMLKEYNKLNISKEHPVHLAEPKYFMPTFDKMHLQKFKYMCSLFEKLKTQGSRQICNKLISQNFLNNMTKESYTNHHWSHLWLSGYFHDSYDHVKLDDVITYVTDPDKVIKFKEKDAAHALNPLKR